MLDVVISKTADKVIAMIVVRLEPYVHTFVEANLFRCGHEVLWQKLALLVEIVAGALYGRVSICSNPTEMFNNGEDCRFKTRTTSIKSSSGPFHFLTSSVASCSFHCSF